MATNKIRTERAELLTALQNLLTCPVVRPLPRKRQVELRVFEEDFRVAHALLEKLARRAPT